MAIIPQPSLFSWQEIDALDDLHRLRLVLAALPDEPLMRHLERDRGRGRDDYPVRAMWKEPDETRVVPGTRNVVYDQQGTVYCHCSKTGCRRQMAYGGMGVPGPDRAMLYRLAVGTGFRANELRSLTPESFDLDADPPTVTVEAGYSKHRRRDVQPIRRDLAERLRPCLADKEPGRPVFRVFSKTAKMMRADLHRAGIPYRDSAGRVADFHALRHTYISRLVQSGVNVKVAQELARHSTPMLTLGVYTHLTLHDRTAALDALAPIETPDPRRETTKATGTGDETASPARSAFSARRYPGTPILAMTCQDEGPRTGKEKGAQV